MNETVTAFLKVSHNLVRTGMYSFLFVRLVIMSRGPDRTFQGAVSGPRAVVCPSLVYTMHSFIATVMLTLQDAHVKTEFSGEYSSQK